MYATRNFDLKNSFSLAIFIPFGIYYQIAILRPPQDLAFIPYQNYIIVKFTGEEGSGEQRQRLYMEEFTENTRQ
jgi:hypothetical protein